jgi:hypothetical protein
MRLERLRQVREFISKLPIAACDMTNWLNIAVRWGADGCRETVTLEFMEQHGFQCGTVGCIAGWTSVVACQQHRDIDVERLCYQAFAMEYLDLAHEEADCLFVHYPRLPEGQWKSYMVQRLDAILTAGRFIYCQQCYCYAKEEPRFSFHEVEEN